MINIYCEFNNTRESVGISSITEISWHKHDVLCLQMRLGACVDTGIPCNTSESAIRSHRRR